MEKVVSKENWDDIFTRRLRKANTTDAHHGASVMEVRQ